MVGTALVEHGSDLSEGQRQRFAIAREVFSDCPVVLQDVLTEQRLLNDLRVLTDMTVVIVAHRKAAPSIRDRMLRFTESGV